MDLNDAIRSVDNLDVDVDLVDLEEAVEAAELDRLRKQAVDVIASRRRLLNNIDDVLGDLDNLDSLTQEQADEILKRLFPDEDDS